jgi:FixJ family two-component response regulator
MWSLIIAVILFIAADIIIRFSLKKVQENREKKKRLQALEDGLKIEYGSEVKSLKRVEVEFPKARIICIDDEPVILDSFRKILVMAGYSVDTVEQGKEALGLIRKNHYDFAFVDIKMPEMDGVEVTKQVKYVRPDIDVIIITGYASVETAVETMKFGAMDYFEKPFTEDELLELTEKCLVRRNARIKRELGPRVQIAEMSELENRCVHQ